MPRNSITLDVEFNLITYSEIKQPHSQYVPSPVMVYVCVGLLQRRQCISCFVIYIATIGTLVEIRGPADGAALLVFASHVCWQFDPVCHLSI